ncbi:hypothetical protein NL676_038865 [Syzygium grande]|nr:hypothetical protein NL676_038865 [Syzygium grande]
MEAEPAGPPRSRSLQAATTTATTESKAVAPTGDNRVSDRPSIERDRRSLEEAQGLFAFPTESETEVSWVKFQINFRTPFYVNTVFFFRSHTPLCLLCAIGVEQGVLSKPSCLMALSPRSPGVFFFDHGPFELFFTNLGGCCAGVPHHLLGTVSPNCGVHSQGV